MRCFYGVSLVALLCLGMVSAGVAETAKTPVLVELFTSQFCPNCPAVERDLLEKAKADHEMLLVMAHVDYWDDEEAGRKDPDGLADVTARQYDYSNTLADRPGKVFTPQPVLDGARVAEPPLFLTWGRNLSAAKSNNNKVLLGVSQDSRGGFVVSLPGNGGANTEVWMMALAPIDGGNAWVVKGLARASMVGDMATLGASVLPKTPRYLAVLQEGGLGAVKGIGLYAPAGK